MLNNKVDKELINYISRGRGAGVLDEELRDVLLDAGWLLEEIDQALREAGSHLPIINAEPTTSELSLERTNTHRRVFLSVIVVIGIVFIGTIGVFAYQSFVQNKSPERKTVDFLTALAKTSGFNYEGSLNLNLDYRSRVVGNSTSSVELPAVLVSEKSTTTVVFSGSVASPEGKRPSFLLTGEALVDRSNQDVFRASLETRLIEDKLYLFLSQIDRLPLLDLESLLGFWLSVSPADMALVGLNSSITAPSVNQVLTWRKAIAYNQSFYLEQFLGREKVNGIDVLKYTFTLDLGDSHYLFDQLVEITGSNDLSDRVAALSGQDLVMGEIWLGAKDHLPYKISLSSVFSDGAKELGTSGYFDLHLKLSNFNQEIIIDQPGNSRSLSSVFTASQPKP